MSGRFILVRSCRKLICFLPRQKIAPRHVWWPSVSSLKPVCRRTMSNGSSEEPQSRDGIRSCEKKDQEQTQNLGASSKKMSSRQKLSLVFAEYGVTAVVFHTGISLASLGLCYLAVSSGLDVPGFLIKIGFSESISQSVAAKGASTFVIAYACHKVFMPVRIFTTVTCTPLIVFRLRKLGLIK